MGPAKEIIGYNPLISLDIVGNGCDIR